MVRLVLAYSLMTFIVSWLVLLTNAFVLGNAEDSKFNNFLVLMMILSGVSLITTIVFTLLVSFAG